MVKFYEGLTNNWSQLRNGISHTGRSKALSISKPKLLWVSDIGEGIFTEVMLGATSNLYIGNDKGCLELELSTGSQKRVFHTFSPCQLLAVDTIYNHLCLNDDDGWSHLVDLVTGNERWSIKTGATGFPTIAPDGTIYLGSNDRNLYAITPDGEILWKFQVSGNFEAGQINQGPAISKDGIVYIGTLDGYVYAIDRLGNEQWRQAVPDGVYSALCLNSCGAVQGVTNAGRIFSITAIGALEWVFEINQEVAGNLAVGNDDTIYVPTWMGGEILAINKEGKQKWVFQTQGMTTKSVTLTADGVIYFTEEVNGNLYAINADGTLLWCYNLQDSRLNSSPILNLNGTIYTASGEGKLYAIGAEE